MNADTLKRIVRAVVDGSQSDLEQLVQQVIEGERKSGHTRLAKQLEEILQKHPKKHQGQRAQTDSECGLKELPLSRRYEEQLAAIDSARIAGTSHGFAERCGKSVPAHRARVRGSEHTVFATGKQFCFTANQGAVNRWEQNGSPGTRGCRC